MVEGEVVETEDFPGRGFGAGGGGAGAVGWEAGLGEEIGRGGGGVDGGWDEVDVFGAFGGCGPGWDVGEEVGEDEVDAGWSGGGERFLGHPRAFREALAVGHGLVFLLFLLVHQAVVDVSFDTGGGAAGAGAEVYEGVGWQGGAQEGLERACCERCW